MLKYWFFEYWNISHWNIGNVEILMLWRQDGQVWKCWVSRITRFSQSSAWSLVPPLSIVPHLCAALIHWTCAMQFYHEYMHCSCALNLCTNLVYWICAQFLFTEILHWICAQFLCTEFVGCLFCALNLCIASVRRIDLCVDFVHCAVLYCSLVPPLSNVPNLSSEHCTYPLINTDIFALVCTDVKFDVKFHVWSTLTAFHKEMSIFFIVCQVLNHCNMVTITLIHSTWYIF